MITAAAGATDVALVALVAGFAGAAVSDLRNREVTDRLWQLMGGIGLVTGAVAVAPGGLVPLALWLLVGALTLEHLFGWDLWIGPRWERHADWIELAAYLGTGIAIATAAARLGIGPSGVPWAVVALFAVVVLARVLFEFGVLYGGADAKALMIAGLLVPVLPVPLLYAPGATATLGLLPFPIALLTNAALFSMAVPVFLAVRNLRRGDFSLPEGMMGYSLPVRDLPHRFVWVKDPAVPADRRDDAETSADDARHRAEVARDLEARGIVRVWVTPQVPFLAVMALGTGTAILVGNVLLDLMLRL
jgi:hypothetical protein